MLGPTPQRFVRVCGVQYTNITARLTRLDNSTAIAGAAVYFWVGDRTSPDEANLGVRYTDTNGYARATFLGQPWMVGRGLIVVAEFRGWGQYAAPLPWNTVTVTR